MRPPYSRTMILALCLYICPSMAWSWNVRPATVPLTHQKVVAPAFSSAHVAALQKDVASFEQTVNQYLEAAAAADADLTDILSDLVTIHSLAKNLHEVDQLLTTIQRLLKYASDVPATRSEAQTLSNAISAVKGPVHAAATSVNNYDKKLTPVRTRLAAFQKKLELFVREVQKGEAELDEFVHKITEAQQCIQDIPDETVRTPLQARLDEIAAKADGDVKRADQILKVFLGDAQSVHDVYEKDMKAAMDKVDDVEKEVERVMHDLADLENPLKDLESFLGRTFRIPIHLGKWSYSIPISIGIILNGIGEIESAIEKYLGKFIFRILKGLGLEKIIKRFLHDIQGQLNAILGRLHLNINVNIPGLGALDADLSRITAAFERIKDAIDRDLQPFEDELKNIRDDLNAFKALSNECTRVVRE